MCPPRKIAFALVVISPTVFSLLIAATAMCFCPVPNPPRVCTEFFAADAVFTGKVISARYLPQGLPQRDPGWLYDLKVIHMYRGPAKSHIDVFTENNSARFPLKQGQTYLLFAYRNDEDLEVYGCGNSSKLSEAGATLRRVEDVVRHENSKWGKIGGRVEQRPSDESSGVAGITLIAQGNGHTYRGVTAKDGSFNIHVPVGVYHLKAGSPAWIVVPYDFSFDMPKRIVVHGGGCADLVFRVYSKTTLRP